MGGTEGQLEHRKSLGGTTLGVALHDRTEEAQAGLVQLPLCAHHTAEKGLP